MSMQVHLYDVLGRRVGTLHNGPLPAQELRHLRLDVSSTGLTSGTYLPAGERRGLRYDRADYRHAVIPT